MLLARAPRRALVVMSALVCVSVASVIHPGRASLAPRRPVTISAPQLGPTFPNDSGAIATTAVGQDTSVYWSFDYGSAGWNSTEQYPVDVYVVAVAHVSQATQCSAASGATRVYRDPGNPGSASGIENLSLGFVWPAGATAAAGGGPYYAVCLRQEAPSPTPDVYSYNGGTLDSSNTTVYKVLNDVAPTITLSATAAYDGQTVTVTGTNWKYYYYPDLSEAGTSVLLVQYPSANTYNYVDTVIPHVDANGNFTVVLHITVAPGTYYVCIGNNWFHRYHPTLGQGLKLQILPGSPPGGGGPGSSSTPTPSATATATSTPTATPDPTAGTALTNLPARRSPVRDGSLLPLLLAGGAFVVLLAGGAVAFFMLRRRMWRAGGQ